MGISLLDLVTEHQDDDSISLRKVMEEDVEVSDRNDSSAPVQIAENIFLWERKEDIRDSMSEGSYIIIDTMFFSTSVVELFDRGLEELKVFSTHEEVRDSGYDVRIGERSEDYSPREGMTLFNSPSFIRENFQGDKRAAMTSENGAKALLNILNGTERSDVFVGSSTNTSAVAEKVNDDEVHLVSSGRKGAHRAEDHLVAYLLAREINGELEDSDVKLMRKVMDDIIEMMYPGGNAAERRKKDYSIIEDINSSDSVPFYEREKEILISV